MRAGGGGDDVHVDLRHLVLDVLEVEPGDAADDADRDGGDLVADRPGHQIALERQLAEGEDGGHVGAGDRRGAGAAVGLQHVAVEGEGAVGERRQVDGGAQAAADQALDLGGAAGDLPLRGLPLVAGMGGARQHRVLGGEPPLAAVLLEGGDPVLDARRDQHAGIADRDQRRAFGEFQDAGLDADRAEGVEGAAVGTGRGGYGAHGAHCIRLENFGAAVIRPVIPLRNH